ncbi:glycosyltransferase [Paenibacillus sp. GCM10023252]|uniref:CgeB family protein n=1 Tax=Paenibacillus sp. GCM10023252 TaxID=3252649 RepID=UPI0036219A66
MKPRAVRQSAQANAFQTGMREGYEAGRTIGWRDGAAEAVMQCIPVPEVKKSRLRILYIPQGFEAIDQGVAEALREVCREVHIGHSSSMAEQASLIRPDLMLVLNGLHVFPDNHLEQADAVRAMGIRTAIWFADDPYVTGDTIKVAPHYDVILTHELSTTELYRQLGCREVHYLPLAVHHGLFKPFKVDRAYQSDVCFIGQAFWNRVELFDAMAERLQGKKVFIAGGLWERLTKYDRLKHAIRMGWLPVEESIKYYNGARIVVNIHRITTAGYDNKNELNYPGRSINPRTYEISACGTLQLTDVREDLSNYYRPGYELDTFNGPEECMAKIEHYLSHEEERQRIAIRGLRRTLQDHTFIIRIQQLLALVDPNPQ